MKPFVPHPVIRGPHRMTLIPRWLPRRGQRRPMPCESRLFRVDDHTQILTKCHWQPQAERCPTLIAVHGLEGCAESHYLLGLAYKGWHAGLNVVRVNQRNCGGTEHLTPTLYHTGMSIDLHTIVTQLTEHDGLADLWVAGFSMGGNLALKFAGEVGAGLSSLSGVVAVCPNIHPAACVRALQEPRNRIYHQYFLPRLKARLRRKAQHFPQRWDLARLSSIRTMWEFDEVFTAPDGGFPTAEEYYERCGARHGLEHIRVPTWIVTSQDDPFIPFHTFALPAMQENPALTLVAPAAGGHCGFYQRRTTAEDGYWVENRIVELATISLLNTR